MQFIKKNDVVSVSYINNCKVYIFFGLVKKIKKLTFTIVKKIQDIEIKKVFLFKNPNLISLKIKK
ncbi:hypothetical protein [Candidatus Carsonella ruddii]|uniref:Uncharacterized protein n=1 Tax=Carsonella ruddii TaxID=114186 RepID=A0AAE7G485_CARRU|nr:hypothetical protein [Candidatus Carsonella ruddii]AGS06636.1 hypothetical protein CRDC_00760 [Candidatus Carsonella ruddii DC]ALA96877.1 hypothetical protein AMC76_00815 [Candidatus Carsonella ruddii]QLK14113.1 hypothetical protein FK493_00825 [Candidatus Carsonella ruddii]